MAELENPKGRGTGENPANRFERIDYVLDEDVDPAERPAPRTQFFKDSSRSAIVYNDSPDTPFRAGLNPYRGCEHGCVYCYARPYHEYLGFSAGLDFESRIMVKEDLPALLKKELSSPRWEPQVIAMSGVTDCYQPIERKLGLTRKCLEVLAEFRNPVGIITKNHLVSRDVDLLKELASHRAAVACLSITTLDPELARAMEPRASHPEKRLEAIRVLSAAGVPVSVNVAPVVPGLTDHELPAIIAAAAKAGATMAGYQLVRLPHGVKDLFADWLKRKHPLRREKVLNQIRSVRHGQLNVSTMGERMKGAGPIAEQVSAMFKLACRKAGLATRWANLSADAFRVPPGPQLTLF